MADFALPPVVAALGEHVLLERLFLASLELTVLAGIVLVFLRLARIRSARVAHWLWLVVLAKPILSICWGSLFTIPVVHVPPNPGSPEKPAILSPSLNETGSAAGSQATGDPHTKQANAAVRRAPVVPEENATAVVPWATLALGAWWLGAAVFAARYFAARTRLHLIIRRASLPPQSLCGRYPLLARQTGTRRLPRLLITNALESTALVGILRPVILVPRWLTDQSSAGGLEWALRHELTHWRFLDPIGVLVRDIAMVVLWFHPLAWWSACRLTEAMELACDRAMLNGPDEASLYAEQLFGILQSIRRRKQVAVAGGLFATRNQVGRRIEALLREPFTRGRWAWCSAGCAILLAGAALAVGASLGKAQSRPAATARPGPDRVLRFPSDFSLGTLLLQDADTPHEINTFHYWIATDSQWERVGPARGSTSVPAGKRVMLSISGASSRELAAIGKLGSDDIHTLVIGRPSDTALKHIGHLTGLRALVFPEDQSSKSRQCAVSPQGIRQLAPLNSLDRMDAPVALTDEGLAAIVDSCPRLKILHIRQNELTDAGIAALSRLQSLEELEIGGGLISDDGLGALDRLPSLRYLLLWGNGFTDEALEHVRSVTSLQILHVGGVSGITDDGLALLKGHPSLQRLNLFDTQVTDAGLVHLKGLPALRQLNLSKRLVDENKPPITAQGTPHLGGLTRLEYLDLPGGLSDEAVTALGGLTGLKHLNMYGGSATKLSDKSLAAIGKMTQLEELAICGTGITDEGLVSLARLAQLRRLELLEAPSLTDAGLARITACKKLEHLTLPTTCEVTISGISKLNSLPRLRTIVARDVDGDKTVLDLSRLRELEELTLIVPLRDSDVACLAGLTRMRRLQLSHDTALTDAGLHNLAGLVGLNTLSLGGAALTDKALTHLNTLGSLEVLRLGGGFTEAGLDPLTGLKTLSVLEIDSPNEFSAKALQAFRKQMPQLGFLRVNEATPGRSAATVR